MNRLRNPTWALIVSFVAILLAVPLVQLVIELRSDEGIVALEFFGTKPTSENLRGFEHKLEAANWAAHLTRPWIQYAYFSWLKEGGEKAVVASHGWYFFKPGLRYMLARPDPSELPRGTNDAVGAIVDFRNQLAARGVNLLVVPVPNKDSIYPDLLTPRSKPPHDILARRTREVLEKLRANGVETVDLFHEFTKARQEPGAEATPLYLAQDTHWSPRGVDLASKAVAHRLIELGWLKEGAMDYKERSAPVPRQGDILRMLQTPRIEQSVPPENVAASHVVRADNGQLYKDEATAEALVLGDSFMRIYQTDAPTSAGFISHLAKELKQPLMSIVNDGGGSTLVREELSSRPLFLKNKKVVVWEFVERDIGIGVKGWRRVVLPPESAKVGN